LGTVIKFISRWMLCRK